jgi:hypothetical protein
LIYVKEHFDIKSVNVSVHRDNVYSVELAKKLGAVFEDVQGDCKISPIYQVEKCDVKMSEGYIRGEILL